MAPTKGKKNTGSVSKVLSFDKPKKRRPGVISKKKNSKLKSSKNYRKRYRGQGR